MQETHDIPASPLNGGDFVAKIEALVQSLLTMRSGSSRPSDVVDGEIWLDTSADPWYRLSLYSQTDDADYVIIGVHKTTGELEGKIFAGQVTSTGAYNFEARAHNTDTGAWYLLKNEVGANRGAFLWNRSNGNTCIRAYDNSGVLAAELQLTQDGACVFTPWESGLPVSDKTVELRLATVNQAQAGVDAKALMTASRVSDHLHHNGQGHLVGKLSWSEIDGLGSVLFTFAKDANDNPLYSHYILDIVGLYARNVPAPLTTHIAPLRTNGSKFPVMNHYIRYAQPAMAPVVDYFGSNQGESSINLGYIPTARLHIYPKYVAYDAEHYEFPHISGPLGFRGASLSGKFLGHIHAETPYLESWGGIGLFATAVDPAGTFAAPGTYQAGADTWSLDYPILLLWAIR